MAEDHAGDLKRRGMNWLGSAGGVSALARGYKYTQHQLDTLIRYEQAIEAIDRAITEEQRATENAVGVLPRIKYEDSNQLSALI